MENHQPGCLGTSTSGGRAFLGATPAASPAAARQRGGRSAGVAGGAAQPGAAQGGAMAMEGDDLGW